MTPFESKDAKCGEGWKLRIHTARKHADLECGVEAECDGIDDEVWKRYAKEALTGGEYTKQEKVKKRYLVDCSIWGVSAALFATIGVSFLLLGPTSYKAEDIGKLWQQVLTYVYVVVCVFTIFLNANAVLIAGVTYALASAMPERHFIGWLKLKEQNTLGRNAAVWVQFGAFSMVLCIVLAATLLHGWPMGVLAAGVSLLLYVLGQATSYSIYVSSKYITKDLTEEPQSRYERFERYWYESCVAKGQNNKKARSNEEPSKEVPSKTAGEGQAAGHEGSRGSGGDCISATPSKSFSEWSVSGSLAPCLT